jgi:hypothetical protein
MLARCLSVKIVVSVLFLTGCTWDQVKHPVQSTAAWYGGHKTQLSETAQLLAQQAAQIAEKDIFSNAQSAEDAVLKSWNVQGFADAGHTLEAALPTLAIQQIPSFVMGLRQIWLGPQDHYSKFAADLGTVLQKNIAAEETKLGRKLLPNEVNQIVEGLIQGIRPGRASVSHVEAWGAYHRRRDLAGCSLRVVVRSGCFCRS